jgi:hypothetical protein
MKAPRWLWTVFAVASAAAAMIVIDHARRFPDGGWDASMVWNLRARFLVRSADLRTAFSPDLIVWTHPDYPWLLPGIVAQGFLLSGGESPAVPALVGAIFGAAAIAGVALGLARMRGSFYGLLGGLTLVTTPAFISCVANQEADVPLGAFLLVSAALVAIWVEDARRPPGLLLLAGLTAGLGAWTKNEGSLYLACIAAALVLRLRDWRAPAWFLFGAAPCLALLAGFKLGIAPRNVLVQFSSAASVFSRSIDPRRWGEFVLFGLRRLVYFQEFALWAVAEVLIVAWLIWKSPVRAPPAVRVVGTALLLACAAYAPIYVLQPHPVAWLVRTSLDRILVQLWPAAILVTLLWLSEARSAAH